jgi:mono/diheme cytochrome c family protein
MRTTGTLAAALALGVVALGGVAAVSMKQAQQPGTAGRASEPSTRNTVDTDEDGQPTKLPPLPSGMTIQMVQQGDSLFRGKGGCITCHGPDATGMPASGSGITRGTSFIPSEWQPIDSLVTAGIPEAVTRSPIAMPPNGALSNLTPDEVKLIAAYVWAIAHVRGEPWPGGHATHAATTAQAAQPAATPAGGAPKRP